MRNLDPPASRSQAGTLALVLFTPVTLLRSSLSVAYTRRVGVFKRSCRPDPQ
jgi:hypothetical protein